MSQEDVTSDGGYPPASAERLRRPPLERSEPRRSWDNLYSPGRADSGPAPSSAPAEAEAASPSDAAARVVREGYRVVEENLRRGRQVAADLRGKSSGVADFASRMDVPHVVSQLAPTLLDPALTEQLMGVARSFLSLLSAVVPPAPAATPRAANESAPRVPLHPQERTGYEAGARVLKVRRLGPGEWLADMEIDGEVRRVQMRAVDGDL